MSLKMSQYKFFFMLTKFALVCTVSTVIASPPRTTQYIKLDQFGYLPSAKKVAIVVDPQIGFNAAESFSPGVNTNQYQIRRWTDDVVAYSGTLKSWKNGATHTQSGDKGWWFDFSSVKTPGSYYIFDVKNGVGSYRFEIAATVYDDVLKQAGRMFYYQRIGMAKTAPYTNPKWTDAAAYVSANQDPYATSRFNKGVIATQRDLRGGWMPGIPINMCRRSNRLSYS